MKTIKITLDFEVNELETSVDVKKEISKKCPDLEQIFSSNSTVVKEESNSKKDLDPKENLNPKEKLNSKEEHNSKEELDPKEEPNSEKELNSKEDLNSKESLKPKVLNSKEDLNPKEDQPNRTNRWSLQEHPNKGTPFRNSPSLGSIPKHKRTNKCSKDELSDLPETWDEECQKHLVDFAERYVL